MLREQLIKARKEQGLTQKALALKIGAHSEVYDYLFQHTNGLIPEDEYAKNNGYYHYSDSAIFIKELY